MQKKTNFRRRRWVLQASKRRNIKTDKATIISLISILLSALAFITSILYTYISFRQSLSAEKSLFSANRNAAYVDLFNSLTDLCDVFSSHARGPFFVSGKDPYHFIVMKELNESITEDEISKSEEEISSKFSEVLHKSNTFSLWINKDEVIDYNSFKDILWGLSSKHFVVRKSYNPIIKRYYIDGSPNLIYSYKLKQCIEISESLQDNIFSQNGFKFKAIYVIVEELPFDNLTNYMKDVMIRQGYKPK